MTIRILITLFISLSAISISAQKPTDKNVKISSWRYPIVGVTQPTTYQVLIHNGVIPVETSAMIKKKGLVSRLQKSQDDVNGRTVDYFTYHNFTPTPTDPDLLIEVSFGNYSEGTVVLKDHKIPCTIKGQKLTKENIRECPAYYYERSYSLPYIVRLTNKSGEVLHMESYKGEGVQTFGYVSSGLSGYLRKEELETAFATQQSKEPLRMASQALVSQLDQLEPILQSWCFYSPVTNKVSIASATGKGHDYTALETAQKQAIDAFGKLNRNTSSSLLTELAMPISTWQKELAKLDMINEEARINRRIATGLFTNVALSYAYSWQLDSAEIYISKAQNLAKYAAFGNTNEISELATFVKDRRDKWKAFQAQLSQGKEPVNAPMLLEPIRTKSSNLPYMAITGKDKYAQWATPEVVKKEEIVFQKSFESALEQMLSKATGATPPANNYEERVQRTGFQGFILLLTVFDGKFETIPEEVCKITYLNELTITNNSIKTVPESISQLTELRKLNLSNNNLTSLPASLQQCKKLKMLNIKGNDIPAADIEALKKALPDCKIKT